MDSWALIRNSKPGVPDGFLTSYGGLLRGSFQGSCKNSFQGSFKVSFAVPFRGLDFIRVLHSFTNVGS